MAITRYSSFDVTVNTIADRNNITRKVNHMTVLVKDAIADINAGSGSATYRWDSSDSVWVLISRSTSDTISFDTEEITIVAGKVVPTNIILDNQIWDISLIGSGVIPKIEDLIIDYTGIYGLNAYNGLKLRFTYAFGTISTQISSVISDLNARLDSFEVGLPTKEDLDAMGIDAGTINNGLTVETSVPIGAIFTDTVYTKPLSEPISYIENLQSTLDTKADKVDTYTKTEVQTVLPAIGLDTTNTVPPTRPGQFKWNSDDLTVDVALQNGVTLQLGQENNRLVRNNTGSTILNGTVVMATGSLGNSGRITVAPSTGLFNGAKFIYGITTQDILTGTDGYVTIDGKVRNINTTGSTVGEAWADGDILYLKPNDSGKLTKVEPGYGEIKVSVAKVVHAHSNGTLEIRITSVFNENEYEPRNSNIQSHISNTSNPHSVTKEQIGLGLVTNKAEADLNVLTATKLATPRTITISGDASGSASFDGSANIDINVTVSSGPGGGTVYYSSTFVATAGQTTYNIEYTVGSVSVFANGIKLNTTDFTATNGTSITFSDPLLLGTVVDITSFANAESINVYDRTEVDTLVGDLTLLLDAINGETI